MSTSLSKHCLTCNTALTQQQSHCPTVIRCPCHGSQYNKDGKVIRGPAPLSLALAHVETNADNKIVLKPWTETDFRTGEAPWWKP